MLSKEKTSTPVCDACWCPNYLLGLYKFISFIFCYLVCRHCNNTVKNYLFHLPEKHELLKSGVLYWYLYIVHPPKTPDSAWVHYTFPVGCGVISNCYNQYSHAH